MSSVTSHADQKVMDNKECSKNVRDEALKVRLVLLFA